MACGFKVGRRSNLRRELGCSCIDSGCVVPWGWFLVEYLFLLSCFKAQNIRTEGKHLYRPGIFKEERDIFSSGRASSDKTKHLEFRLCGLGISRISRGKGGGDLPARERICQSQSPIFVSVSTVLGIMAALRSLRIWVDAIWTWE